MTASLKRNCKQYLFFTVHIIQVIINAGDFFKNRNIVCKKDLKVCLNCIIPLPWQYTTLRPTNNSAIILKRTWNTSPRPSFTEMLGRMFTYNFTSPNYIPHQSYGLARNRTPLLFHHSKPHVNLLNLCPLSQSSQPITKQLTLN